MRKSALLRSVLTLVCVPCVMAFVWSRNYQLEPRAWGQANGARIDAAVEMADGKAYFFLGSRYLRFDLSLDRADPDYPRSICPDFGNLPEQWCREGIDEAMLGHDGGKIYFFKGSQYVRIPLSTKQAEPPKSIADGWRGIFPNGIQAAVNGGNGKAYFFSGSMYARFDFLTDQIDSGYPRPITGVWPGWPTSFLSGIDAAFNGLRGRLYFFKGGQYVRYDLATERTDAGYPQDLSVGWKGIERLFLSPPPAPPPLPSAPAPVPVAKPVINVLDKSGAVVADVAFGLWDGAFDDRNQPCDAPNGSILPLNQGNEANNFVGADSRRFFVQVTDPLQAGKGQIQVEVWTEVPTRRFPLDRPTDANVTLREQTGAPGVFRSAALLLVSDPWEVANVRTTDGWGSAALLSRGQPGYRLRVANLASEVVVRYGRNPGEFHRYAVPVMGRTPEQRLVLPLQLYFMVDAAHPMPGLPALRKELSFMRQVYARVGVHIVTEVAQFHPPNQVVAVDSDQVMSFPAPPVAKADYSAVEVKAIAAPLVSMSPFKNVLRVFFIGQLAQGSCGPEKGLPNGCYYKDDPVRDAVFVSHWGQVGSTSAAHEVGHALGLDHLLNRHADPRVVHGNPIAGSRYAPAQNLMGHPPAGQYFGKACYPGRLWDVPIGPPGVTQLRTLRASRFMRPWNFGPRGAPSTLFPASVP